MISTFALFVMLVFLLVLPKYQQSVQLESQRADAQSGYEAQVSADLNLSSMLQQIQTHQDALAKIDSALPASPSLASITHFISQAAQKSNLTIRSVQFSKEASQQTQSSSASQVKNIGFIVNATGSYQGLKEFLSALETSARLFDVDAISFSTGGSGDITQLKNQAISYNFILNVTTHSY